jgi:hypothetical protein
VVAWLKRTVGGRRPAVGARLSPDAHVLRSRFPQRASANALLYIK